MIELLTFLDVLFATLGIFLLFKLFGRRQHGRMPPGPKGWPLLGNMLEMPQEKEWLTFARWGEIWGDIMSVNIAGQPLVIVNSPEIAVDLLDKTSSIYSSRPVMQMGGELVGWKNTLVLLPYGTRFRNYRKYFYQLIGTRAAMRQFHSAEEIETQRFLSCLLQKPEELAAHIRKTAGAIILRISYGYEVKWEGEDPFVTLADVAVEQFSLSTSPGGFMVNLVPALNYLPEWFPGTRFKQTAKEWALKLNEMVDLPFKFVKDQMAAGVADDSFVSRLLETYSGTEAERDIIWSAASLYGGGADTTVASNYSFFLAMMLYPEVQKKAQAEIDAVIGGYRLPSLKDRNDLSYVNALALEVLRWHATAPTSVPHLCTEDNVYNGYFIPKGALVISNVWKMLHDPRVYDNPMIFEPARFLSSSNHAPERDPRDMCFGFGRRICPGRILADESIFIMCAMTLAVFDIAKPVEHGQVVEPTIDQTSGTISHPMPFQCKITPRSEKAVALIHSALNT